MSPKRRKADRPNSQRIGRLPNAPLAEVVFELRWALAGAQDDHPAFQWDPGYFGLADTFTDYAHKAGFTEVRDLHKPSEVVGRGVIRRFYREQNKDFPLWQIGNGIFAVNDSADYDWQNFRKMAVKALSLFTKSYPTLKSFQLDPMHLELRYIDAFDKDFVGTSNLIEFSEKATDLNIKLPSFFDDLDQFDKLSAGRLNLQFPIKRMKDSLFILDLGSAARQSENIVRLESKVVSREQGIPSAKNRDSFVNKVSIWLNDAHKLTSAFFKSFLREEVLKKFE